LIGSTSDPSQASQALVADAAERLSERSGVARREPWTMAGLLAGSLVFHACLFLIIVRLVPDPELFEQQKEIPVEIVIDQKPEKKAEAALPATQQNPSANASPTPAGKTETAEAQPKPEPQKPEPPQETQKPEPPKAETQQPEPPKPAEEKPKPAETAQAAPKPEPPKPAPKPEPPKQAAEQKPASEPKPAQKPPERAAKPAAPKNEARGSAAAKAAALRKTSPAETPSSLSSSFASLQSDLEKQAELRGQTSRGFGLEPDIFRAVAVPLPTEGGAELMSYKEIVFGMLERAKRYPETALARGAHGAAVIGFSIDESGKVVRLSLLESSGEADLDVESLALVDRASPFPAPPPGAARTFAAEITFGEEKDDP
jgi:colicin import membrane protein